MEESLGGILSQIVGNHPIIATILISMFPIIELKGAIPIGMSEVYWGAYALSKTEAFFYALLGSCLIVPLIALMFTPFVNWLKKTKVFSKLGGFIDAKVKKHSDDLKEKSETKSSGKKTLIKCLLLFGFVSVPLPLTGIWTGTCVGVAIGLKLWQTVLSVVLGNIVAGLIITFVCAMLPGFETILSIIFLAIVLCVIIFVCVKFVLHCQKEKSKNLDNNDSEK